MKRKGHNHKESFSVLLVSNTGQHSRQFHISRMVSRLLIVLVFVILVAVGCLGAFGYQYLFGDGGQAGPFTWFSTQQEQLKQLEEEKDALNTEIAALTAENEALRQSVETKMESEDTAESETASAPDPELSIPRQYPSSGTSSLISNFSEEQPYLSINTHTEGNIVATGNGTVVSVTSDDTYPVIVEVEHEKGYRTRYMCRQEADVQATEGAQVEAGDVLFSITVDDTQLDYQILFNEEPIDPLTVFDAKG